MMLVMLRAAVLTLAIALTGVLLPLPATAEIYRYIDERGNPFYVEGLHSVPAQYRAGAVPLGMRNSPASADAPSVAEKSEAAGSTTIRYTPGQRIVVEAKINGGTSTRLLLDTGADTTLISPLVLSAAGASLIRGGTSTRITGVTGTSDVQRVPVDSIEIGEARVSQLSVVAHDMGQPGIDGLLGRDFLDRFKVTIDSSTGLVTIAPK
jgi:predicted aspartyl protease